MPSTVSRAISADLRSVTLSRIVRFIAVVGGGLYVVLIIAALMLWYRTDIHLEGWMKTTFTLVALLPLFMSLFIIHLYEQLAVQRHYTLPALVKLGLFQLYLVIPAVIVLLRYEQVLDYSSSVVEVLGILILLLSPFFAKTKSVRIWAEIRHVYYQAWTLSGETIDSSHFLGHHMLDERRSYYFDPVTLRTFQDTFTEISNEPESVVKLLRRNGVLDRLRGRELSLLDIGGYDGASTERLLLKLRLSFNRVHAMDPAPVQSKYLERVGRHARTVTAERAGFQDYSSNPKKKFDIVLMSHSAYALVDMEGFDSATLIQHVLSHLNTQGLVIITLGSRDSTAYAVKRAILNLIYGQCEEDLNAEVVHKIGLSIAQQSGCTHVAAKVDNYIHVDPIVANPTALSQWASYFARVPLLSDKFVLENIKAIIMSHSVLSNEIPECTRNGKFNVHSAEWLLPHKTEIQLIYKD